MGASSPHRRRCSSDLQKEYRVLAAMSFYGLILWHRGTIRFASSVSFCILFLTSQKKYARGATAAASPYQRHSGETGQKDRQGRPPLYEYHTLSRRIDAFTCPRTNRISPQPPRARQSQHGQTRCFCRQTSYLRQRQYERSPPSFRPARYIRTNP